MQRDHVTDSHIGTNRQRLANVSMQHAAILHVAVFTDRNGRGVAAQHSVVPNTGMGCEHDIPHHLGTLGDPCCIGNFGRFVF